jgi:hypothetical protein
MNCTKNLNFPNKRKMIMSIKYKSLMKNLSLALKIILVSKEETKIMGTKQMIIAIKGGIKKKSPIEFYKDLRITEIYKSR